MEDLEGGHLDEDAAAGPAVARGGINGGPIELTLEAELAVLHDIDGAEPRFGQEPLGQIFLQLNEVIHNHSGISGLAQGGGVPSGTGH